MIQLILNSQDEDFAKLEEVKIEIPPKAQLHENIICDAYGETAMETRIKLIDGKKYCLPCADIDRRKT